jgi:hypothetical protein
MLVLEYTNNLIEELFGMGGSSKRRRPYKGPRPRGSIKALVWTANKNAAKNKRILQAKIQRKAMSNNSKKKIEMIKKQ